MPTTGVRLGRGVDSAHAASASRRRGRASRRAPPRARGHAHGQAHRLAEPVAEGVLDPGAQPALELGAGELVGHRDHGGVLGEHQRPAEVSQMRWLGGGCRRSHATASPAAVRSPPGWTPLGRPVLSGSFESSIHAVCASLLRSECRACRRTPDGETSALHTFVHSLCNAEDARDRCRGNPAWLHATARREDANNPRSLWINTLSTGFRENPQPPGVSRATRRDLLRRRVASLGHRCGAKLTLLHAPRTVGRSKPGRPVLRARSRLAGPVATGWAVPGRPRPSTPR